MSSNVSRSRHESVRVVFRTTAWRLFGRRLGRGTLALFRTSQARAYLEGRDFVIPEDVKKVAVPVLAHRLALDTKAKYSGIRKEDVVRETLESVPVGV